MTDDHRRNAENAVREPEPRRNTAWALEQIEQALRGLQFGQILETVQDGVVVQVERTEKFRVEKGGKRGT